MHACWGFMWFVICWCTSVSHVSIQRALMTSCNQPTIDNASVRRRVHHNYTHTHRVCVSCQPEVTDLISLHTQEGDLCFNPPLTNPPRQDPTMTVIGRGGILNHTLLLPLGSPISTCPSGLLRWPPRSALWPSHAWRPGWTRPRGRSTWGGRNTAQAPHFRCQSHSTCRGRTVRSSFHLCSTAARSAQVPWPRPRCDGRAEMHRPRRAP
mmetsp:Transcript_52311/g.131473  ORF Transcript_52311/g.131473 Transcript_52311/m.131473 type:complete len:209 (+) Transcript_52311:464-1090(+)